MKIGSSFTIFLLFFGMALIEALESGSLLKTVFWVAIALVFLVSDRSSKGKET